MGDVLAYPSEPREDAAEAPEVEGVVIPFPTADREGEALPSAEDDAPEPNCFYCKHVAIGDSVTYCSMWREEILVESLAARDCEAYEFDDDAALTWGD